MSNDSRRNHKLVQSLAAAKLLPPHFLFGAATSATQIEGGWNQDGRGPTIWDRFLHVQGGPHSGDTADITCDHYNRVDEDVELMRKLGLDAYRFSIAWSRIFPTGRGQINQPGLDFYDRLVDKLLAAGIQPFPTLYHWDLPAALQDDFCGWLGRETTQHFADYASAVVRRLGDRVKNWTTFNEPEVIIAGTTGGGMAPGLNRGDLGFHTGHHLMVAHGMAAQAIRAAGPSDTKVGIVLNFNVMDPADGSEAAARRARLNYVRAYRWYLDGLLNGQYPEEVACELRKAPKLPANCSRRRATDWVRGTDMKLVSQPLDFLGLNYYTRFVFDGDGKFVEEPGHVRTQMGWQVYPVGLTRLLEEFRRTYTNLPPVYVTENGAAFDDTLTGKGKAKGRIHDETRTQFLADHMVALAAAVMSGVDVRGYFAWSLMDNLEWPLGFAKTFGLVHVDRRAGKTFLRRTIKDSGRFYARFIGAHKRTRSRTATFGASQ